MKHDKRLESSSYTATSDEFAKLVIEPELESGQFISLEDGHIVFDEYPVLLYTSPSWRSHFRGVVAN